MTSSADNVTSASTNRSYTPEQTAEAIKNIAKNIREASYRMRETVKTIRQSGAIEELTEAVREASLAARDTAREINETARDLKERGVIQETISAAEETNTVAREAAQTVRDTVSRTPSLSRSSEKHAESGNEVSKTSGITT